MRLSLLVTFVTMMACTLVGLSVPFTIRLASDKQQVMYLDRLQSTDRFAAIAAQAADAVDDQALHDDLIRYHEVYGVSAAVLDRDGSVWLSSGSVDPSESDVRSAQRLALSGHRSGNPQTVWPVVAPRLVVAVPIVHGDDVVGAVLTVSPTGRLDGDIRSDVLVLAVADLAALALIALIAARLSRWMLHPVSTLDAAARQMSTGDLTVRVTAADGPVEIRRLASSFNRMAGVVDDVVRRQENLVTDASHQLRNPLTALILRLESLPGTLDELQKAEITEILHEADRLHTVLGQLLQLASVEHVLTVSSTEADVVELVAGRVAAWQPSATRRDILIDFIHPIRAAVRTDVALVSSALDVVLENAIKFSPAGSRIVVEVATGACSVDVTVTDQGPGLRPEEFERIGERFWRAPAARQVAGSGLGLSIATELAAALRGRLTFAPAQPTGLRVTLTLPQDDLPDVAGAP